MGRRIPSSGQIEHALPSEGSALRVDAGNNPGCDRCPGGDVIVLDAVTLEVLAWGGAQHGPPAEREGPVVEQ